MNETGAGIKLLLFIFTVTKFVADGDWADFYALGILSTCH